MKIKISTESEVEGFSGDFKTLEVDKKDELTIDNCRNIVALSVAKRAFDSGEVQKQGMWIAEVIK